MSQPTWTRPWWPTPFRVVAGVLVAVGAVVGVYWRKAKKKVQDKLGIDENAKKEVEDDIVEFTDEKKDW